VICDPALAAAILGRSSTVSIRIDPNRHSAPAQRVDRGTSSKQGGEPATRSDAPDLPLSHLVGPTMPFRARISFSFREGALLRVERSCAPMLRQLARRSQPQTFTDLAHRQSPDWHPIPCGWAKVTSLHPVENCHYADRYTLTSARSRSPESLITSELGGSPQFVS
jgi:hypothetical protein